MGWRWRLVWFKAVAELLAIEHPTRMRMVGMPDEFAVVGPTLRADAHYVVRYGRDEAPAGDMGLEEFPWTADGARRAHAKFTALVSAASVAQSEMPAARAQVQA